ETPAPSAQSGVIETDPRKFQQIVFNFLSNAVKFTPEGGSVTLRAERVSAGEPEPRVRVSVLDSGPGIAREDQQRIFEKFTRLESGHTSEHAGTGLGLAICKELTGMIQGEIQLVSESGQGSMFSLIVPVRMDPDRAAQMHLLTAGRGVAALQPSAAQSLDEPTRA
ncbi:MAG: ATP-binding protein, partial [Planctomycetota bacterium]|nr:ATP-binding protein [Planctomycetota bacterium]